MSPMSNRRQRRARADAEAHNARQRQLRAAAKVAPQPGLAQATADAIALAVDAGLEPDVARIAVGAVLGVLPQMATPGADPRETASPPLIGVDDPYALDSVLVPVGSALLPHGWSVSAVDARLAATGEIERCFALQIHSRINGAPSLVDHTYLLDLDGLAKLGAEFYALASRAGVINEFLAAQHDALEALPI